MSVPETEKEQLQFIGHDQHWKWVETQRSHKQIMFIFYLAYPRIPDVFCM